MQVMTMADRPLRVRIRDALFQHLAPPFAGLVATVFSGPVAGAAATGVTATLAERFTTHEDRARAGRRIDDVADKAIGALAEFIEAEWPHGAKDSELNPEAAARELGNVVERGMSEGVFFRG